MVIIGIDVASRLTKCGLAIGRWLNGRVEIESAGLLESRLEPDALGRQIAPRLVSREPVLLALDAPLGWPSALGEALVHHRAGELVGAEKDRLFARETDRLVYERLKQKPLEVGADKIARAAHTALQILERLRRDSGQPIPLAWHRPPRQTSAIEVYPAATLRATGLPYSGYKDSEKNSDKRSQIRREISDGVQNRMPGLHEYIEAQDDIFDACLCLLAASDFLEGQAAAPQDGALAAREGWIWVR